LENCQEFQEGTIFLLNDNTKICTEGRFIIKLKALDDGIVGLVFRYETDKDGNSNYYILELSGMPDEKFIRIRKKIGNKFTLVSSNPTMGYKKNEWFKIILTIEVDKFNAFVTENSSQDNIIKVFAHGATDSAIKNGMVGISTYKTKIIVDEISLSPFDNLDKTELVDDLLYIDEEELDCKFIFFIFFYIFFLILIKIIYFLVPTNKLKDKTLFSRVNTHIKNFSWATCLSYPIHEDRKKYCNVLFSSSVEIKNCKNDFCESCCNKTVDNTNKEHNFLCNRQCQVAEIGTKKKTWESCIESTNPETSVYPYCDEQFPSDYFSKQRCKSDMCNLCCITMDHKHVPLYTDEAMTSCYSKCTKTFNTKPALQDNK
jgi:hypothetical protein